MCSSSIAPSANAASSTVNPQTMAMAPPPTSPSFFSEVFIPSAAMAMIRHQRDSSSSSAVASGGITLALPTSTSAAKPMTKNGIGSPRGWPGARPLPKTTDSPTTTGTSRPPAAA